MKKIILIILCVLHALAYLNVVSASSNKQDVFYQDELSYEKYWSTHPKNENENITLLSTSDYPDNLTAMRNRAEAIVNYEWVPSVNISTWNKSKYNGSTVFKSGDTIVGMPYTLFTSEIEGISDSLLSLAQYKSKATSNFSSSAYCVSVSANRTGPAYGSCCATFVSEVFGGNFMYGDSPRYDGVSALKNSQYTEVYENIKVSDIRPGDALAITGHVIWVGDINENYVTIYEQTPPVARKKVIFTPDSDQELTYEGNTYKTIIRPTSLASTDITITSPANGSWQDPRKDITVTWNSMEGAAGYRYAVKCTSGEHINEKPYDNVWTTGNSFTIPYGSLYHNETYDIWIGGYANESASESLTAGDLITINVMSGPQIQHPSNNYAYAHPANTTIMWSEVESASSYLLTLVNTDTGTDIYRNMNVGNTLSYTLTNLEPDTQYKVAIGTDDGWWSQGDFYFKTSQFPEFSPRYTLSGNSIIVQWSAVPGAYDYQLLLKDSAGYAVEGYNYVSTNGETYYTITGLEYGETYKVNICGLINEVRPDKTITQQFWGTESITFTIPENEDIPVPTIPVTGVYLKPSTTLEVGETETLFATVQPSDASGQEVIWHSSDTSVATVSDGVVTAKAAGTANITVTTLDGGYSATCVVTVTEVSGEADTLQWIGYENGQVLEYAFDFTRPVRTLQFEYTTTSSELPEMNISNSDVLYAEFNTEDDCIDVYCSGEGTATLSLSVGGKTISLTFTFINTASSTPEELSLSWRDYENGATIERTFDSSSSAPVRPFIAYYTISPTDFVYSELYFKISDESVISVTENDGSLFITPESAGTSTVTLHVDDQCISLNFVVTDTASEDTNNGTDSNGISWCLEEGGSLAISGTGNMEDYASTSSIPWYANRADITEITITDGITHIGSRSFYNCISAEKITIPSSVTSIGNYAFKNCVSLSIYGEKGSYAETYAKVNGISFVSTTDVERKTISVDMIANTSTWCFDISIEGYTNTATAYAAIYDVNGKMLALTSEAYLADEVTTLILAKTGIENAAYAKIFVWDSSLTPIALASDVGL